MQWFDQLKINPVLALLKADNPALVYFAERDLLDSKAKKVEVLWNLPEPAKLIRKQLANGSWKYPGKTSDKGLVYNHDLLETFRNLRYLVEKYGFTRKHPTLSRAAEYVFSCQTDEGDIRGILANQYMPYYMAAILELLIKAGYEKDERLVKGMQWLFDMRQEDGGWIIPLQVYKITYIYQVAEKDPIPPDRKKPFSHLATGMILRAFAAHPDYCRKPEIKRAGELLKSRIFQPDAYNDHKAKEYWTKFQFPFWWTDLLSALDSLFKLGFTRADADVTKGLQWLIHNQPASGLWKACYEKRPDMDLWVSLAVCRILKNYFGS